MSIDAAFAFLLNLLGGVVAAVLAILLRDYLSRDREKRKLAREAEVHLRLYADPLREAARSLEYRLTELVDGRDVYFSATAPKTEFVRYKRHSTLYRLAALLGWIRAVRRERSYLDPQSREVPPSISRIEEALADGQRVEVHRARGLLSLWSVECAEDSMATLAGEIDVIRHRYAGTESAKDLSHLSEDIQSTLVSECARAVEEHTNTVVNKDLLANRLSVAIAYLGIREAYIYRDWQEGIGDLMIRPARVGERHFEVVGYREFESIYRDDGNADWISSFTMKWLLTLAPPVLSTHRSMSPSPSMSPGAASLIWRSDGRSSPGSAATRARA